MNDFINKELNHLIVGDLLGEGHARKVYAHRQDKSLVIKIEEGSRRFSNTIEWEMWQHFNYAPLGKWLAPCVDISPCGTILLMKRALPARMKEMPAKVPATFTDLKIENWGMLDGKIVCVDYGNLIYNSNMRLKKADWWEQK